MLGEFPHGGIVKYSVRLPKEMKNLSFLEAFKKYVETVLRKMIQQLTSSFRYVVGLYDLNGIFQSLGFYSSKVHEDDCGDIIWVVSTGMDRKVLSLKSSAHLNESGHVPNQIHWYSFISIAYHSSEGID